MQHTWYQPLLFEVHNIQQFTRIKLLLWIIIQKNILHFFFNHTVWPDSQGQTLKNNITKSTQNWRSHTQAHVVFTFHFVRSTIYEMINASNNTKETLCANCIQYQHMRKYLTSLWNTSSTEAWVKLGGTQSAFSLGKAEKQCKWS